MLVDEPPAHCWALKTHGCRLDDIFDGYAVFGSSATRTSPVDFKATVDFRLLRQNQSSGFTPCSRMPVGHESDDASTTYGLRDGLPERAPAVQFDRLVELGKQRSVNDITKRLARPASSQ